jgi:prepilin-type N-terminal cleavage/methylation domain-containing protein
MPRVRVKFAPLAIRRAFTLVELLVVIAIIGLLSSVAVVSLSGARSKARDAKRLADIVQIRKALELYYSVNNQYPASGGAVSPNNVWTNSIDSSWATFQTALAPYLAVLPKDPTQSSSGFPSDPNTYGYGYFSVGYGCDLQWYMMVYRLENGDGLPDRPIRTCDGTTFAYGDSVNPSKVKTVGQLAGK